MNAMEIVSSILFGAYLFSFFSLTAYAAHESGQKIWLFSIGEERQVLPAWMFRLAFAGAALWPLIRAAADLWPDDPVRVALDGTALDLIGHLLVAIGAVLAAASQMHMGTSWRIGAAEGRIGAMVMDGPFVFSRNPVFVGQMLLFTGLFCVFPSSIQGLLTVALFVAVHLQVRIEERVLARTIGAPYLAYKAEVNRWLGVTRRKVETL